MGCALTFYEWLKINFEAVAKENGYTNPRSASNKLAAMKKSAGISATSSSNDKPAASTAAVRDGKVTKRTLRKNNKALSKKVEGATESTKDS